MDTINALSSPAALLSLQAGQIGGDWVTDRRAVARENVNRHLLVEMVKQIAGEFALTSLGISLFAPP
jgi:hypothetical protein